MRLLDYLFVALLFIMALSIIGLFAMMGELSARIGPENRRSQTSDARLTPLRDVQLGITPAWWPPALQHISQMPHGAVLVLSNLCESCVHIAEDLAGTDLRRAPSLGLVVSCGSREAGQMFVQDTDLGTEQLYIDEMGDWTQTNFGVNVSPALLQFQFGSLNAADTLVSVRALEAATNHETVGVHDED